MGLGLLLSVLLLQYATTAVLLYIPLTEASPTPLGSQPLPGWLPSRPPGKNMIIHNNCPFNIWPAYVGTDERTGTPVWGRADSANPAGNTTPMPSGAYKVVPVYNGAVAVRVWARTGCKRESDGRFVCAIGDCGNAENNFDGSCYRSSGKGAISLAEFSFTANNGNTFYDLSLVDGYTVPISITLVGTAIDTPGSAPDFSCGNPFCRPDQSFSQCPPELKKRDATGKVIGCFNIHAAAADEELRAGATYGAYLTKIWTDAELWSRTACDALTGDCGGNNVQETLYSGNHIKRGTYLAREGGNRTGYACSPFIDWMAPYKDEFDPFICYDERKPKPLNGFGRDWGIGASPSYAQLFKKICPLAYSWQFNDGESTFQCMGNDLSYIIDFC